MTERARRIQRLRRRVAVAATATFLAAFGVVAGSGSLGATTNDTASTGIFAGDDDESDDSGITSTVTDTPSAVDTHQELMQLFWIASRAGGIAAVLFASLSVGLGLAIAMGLTRRRLRDPRALHEALGLATLAALGVHTVTLLFDTFLKFTPRDLLVPFASSYHPIPMAIGIVSAYALVALSLTYYARRWIGPARWRSAHRLIAVAWGGGMVHGLLMGTDASRPWFLAAVGAVALPAVALLAARWIPETA